MDKKIDKISRAIIPVAGLGTRMLPATKAIPKEMLPLVDRPLIQYVINECAAAGIDQIVLVTHASKNSIENHFDTSFELEATLEKRVKRQLLAEVSSICPKGMTLIHIRQGHAMGLGHAILCARPILGDLPIAVILPDVIINQYQADSASDNLSAMCRRFEESGASQVMVDSVPLEAVSQYGIVDCDSASIKPGCWSRMRAIIEKPEPGLATSNLAAVGRYVLSEEIWPLLSAVTPGRDSEIQLTDAICQLAMRYPVEIYRLVGRSHDCGNKLGYAQVFAEYALQHADIGTDFRSWLQQFITTLPAVTPRRIAGEDGV